MTRSDRPAGPEIADEFLPLIAEHTEFQEAVLVHQEALVRGDLDGAERALEGLRAHLAGHIRHENEVLIPVVEAGGHGTRLGRPEYLRGEHDDILAAADRVLAETRALRDAGDRIHREVALQIGREHAFLHLLEHHDEREQRAFFPDLTRLTTAGERQALVARRRRDED